MTTASGLGLTTLINGFALDAWFPAPALGPLAEDPALREQLTAAAQRDEARGTIQEVVALEIDLDAAPESTADAYLRLHLLSHRVMQPNTINLDGIFTHLPNVVWTTEGPCRIEGFELVRAKLRAEGRMPTVLSIDKFPRMVDYVLPTGVRIADADRVRLGAHLADGTTVMHEGFVNFNAGTLGTSMIEGRISQGVVVEADSDLGGGSSTMGTLSGGGKERVRIGRRCLIGAEAGVGIALGDDCVVEAGTYITAGTKVTLISGDGSSGPRSGAGSARDTGTSGTSERVVKARELSGLEGLLFRRNSVTGRVEAVAKSGVQVTLDAQLHAN